MPHCGDSSSLVSALTMELPSFCRVWPDGLDGSRLTGMVDCFDNQGSEVPQAMTQPPRCSMAPKPRRILGIVAVWSSRAGYLKSISGLVWTQALNER